MSEINIIFYHSKCPDGNACIFCFDYLDVKGEYIPVNHGEKNKVHNIMKNKDKENKEKENTNIFVVDFCFTKEVIEELANMCKNIYIIDHHISNKNDVLSLELPNLTKIFDESKAACLLCWDFLIKYRNYKDIKKPWFLDYISDRDTWQWKLPYSKEINMAMYKLKYTTHWNNIRNIFDKSQEYFKDIGDALLKVEEDNMNFHLRNYTKALMRLSKENVENEIDAKIKYYNVVMTDCPRNMRSDVCNGLASMEGVDIAVSYYYSIKDDEWWISLRLSDDSPLDLTQIKPDLIKGHRRAAGFTIYPSKGENLRTYFDINPV